jgi:predicted PurR-regulated permease PerM
MTTSTNQFVRNVLAAVCIGIVLYIGWRLRNVILLAVLALFLAVALSAPVNALERRLGLPRAIAILLMYLALLGLLVAIGLLVVPPLVHEFEQFLKALPEYVRDLERSRLIARWDRQYGLLRTLSRQADRLPTLLGGALGGLESVTVGAIKRLVELVAIFAVAFLLLLDAPRLLALVEDQLPAEQRERARRLAREAAGAVGGYVAGVFAVALLAGIVSFVAMTVLGIPYAVPLATQMALFAIVPLVGSTIGATVIGFVAAFSGLGTVIVWALFWIAYQQTETHVVSPLVYRRAVDMRPVLVILSVLAGASLLGILGALLAIPAAATLQLLLREWWSVWRSRRDARGGGGNGGNGGPPAEGGPAADGGPAPEG